MGLQDAVKNLRGEPGSQVRMTLLRPSTGQVKEYTLNRAIINVDMVKDINGKKEFPLDENKIGYVRLLSFESARVSVPKNVRFTSTWKW